MGGMPYLLFGGMGLLIYCGYRRQAKKLAPQLADAGAEIGGIGHVRASLPANSPEDLPPGRSTGQSRRLRFSPFAAARRGRRRESEAGHRRTQPRHRTARPPHRRHRRSKLLEAVAGRIRGGTSYQQLLAAPLLAGVRGIQPRPVGFKFHAVLVVNSAHLASLAAADHDRWLPLFWAIDNFKASQATNKAEEGDWMMPPVNEAKLPVRGGREASASPRRWTTGTRRPPTAPPRRWPARCRRSEAIELFWRYGARDFRDIGHKAIYVANSWRTLQTIGWRHAEPVLRSLAFALLEHEGDNPAKRDADPDRPWRENLKRAAAVPRRLADRQADRPTRRPSCSTPCAPAAPPTRPAKVTDVLKKGVASVIAVGRPVPAAPARLLMRQPGIVGLHCVTTANALHFAYGHTGNDETRRMMLLQAAAFLPMFRKAMAGRGTKLADLRARHAGEGGSQEQGRRRRSRRSSPTQAATACSRRARR